MPDETQLPRYQCHKQVQALKIRKIYGRMLHFEREQYAPLMVSQEYLDKHKPTAPGYYVVYEDGYESWSPVEAFESGYTEIKQGR